MRTYDHQGKVYKSTYFLVPGGEIVSFNHAWDEKTQILRRSAPLGGGTIGEAQDPLSKDGKGTVYGLPLPFVVILLGGLGTGLGGRSGSPKEIRQNSDKLA